MVRIYKTYMGGGVVLTKYLIAHWRGELSLTKSALFNGLLLYVAIIAAMSLIDMILPTGLNVYSVLAVFLPWTVWACVGIVRCAIKIVTASETPLFNKTIAVLILIIVIAVVVLTIRDFLHFF